MWKDQFRAMFWKKISDGSISYEFFVSIIICHFTSFPCSGHVLEVQGGIYKFIQSSKGINGISLKRYLNASVFERWRSCYSSLKSHLILHHVNHNQWAFNFRICVFLNFKQIYIEMILSFVKWKDKKVFL